MRAAILRNGAMVVDDIDDLTPAPGQVLVETIACGICGSDLHTVDHADEMVEVAIDAGSSTFHFDPAADLVMGHELAVRVLEAGPGVDDIEPGTAMAAMPMLTAADGGTAVPGYDNRYPGGYSERMLLAPGALLPVPNGLDPKLAALTEPLAVGLHAVNQSSVGDGRPAIVVGAGPVGLSVIASLSLAGVEPIIASDFSPRRRALAAAIGANVVLDPGSSSDRNEGFAQAIDALSDEGVSAPPVVFEAVGVPGMLDMTMTGAPTGSEIIVVGVCMEHDRIRPMMGIFKHLTVRFVLGWTPEEFATSLTNLAEGRIDSATLVTGEVDLDGVPGAFRALADPEEHVKILVRPNG